MKKLISIIAGVILPFISGCTSVSSSSPNHELKPIISEEAKEETKIPYEQISQLAIKITNSIEKNFPNGLVIEIGKDKKGNNRYVSFNVLKEDKGKGLEAATYLASNQEAEKNLEGFLLNKNYEKAIKTLKENNIGMALFYDSGINGLRKTDIHDFMITRGDNGGEIKLNIGEYLLKSANELYFSMLNKSLFPQ